MTQLHFAMTIKSFEKQRELCNQFKHYLDHVLRVTYVQGKRDREIIVEADENKSADDIFGGPNGEFRDIFHFERIN